MKLAINGGSKIRSKYFPAQITIGKEEQQAVQTVMERGILSGYRGNSSKAFYGGPQVLYLESEWKRYFNSQNAIAVNSCTSALQIACGAIGLKQGDEVIVTPWSMSCSATAPMMWGAVPVFADIEEDNYCLDINDVRKKITDKTKAIIVVDLFGQPYNQELNSLAKEHRLYIIEDAAQAIGSNWNEVDKKHGAYAAGTLGHIGCYSFTQGKHLTSGEGGMIVTGDEDLAHRCELLRNHAEAVNSDKVLCILNSDLYGFNMRMTEIQAAIISEQLKKLNDFISMRVYNVSKLNNILKDIPFIRPSGVRDKCSHSYYVQSFKYDHNVIHRDVFINAVKAELMEEENRLDKGVPIGCGYIKPLYRMPIFQELGYKDLCPIAEKLWKNELFLWTLHGLPLTDKDMQDIGDAFYKVADNMGEIK